MAHSVFVAEGWFQGRMYLIDAYPGVIASECKEDRVFGEVYRLAATRPVLSVLDDYEACGPIHVTPTEYSRTQVSILTTQDGMLNPVWIYLYQWPVQADALIQTGDFMQAAAG